jgi:O-antigen chain-terminating methyltransferase
MKENNIEGIIEIGDPEIDVEKIMARIRENIRRRREEAKQRGLDFDNMASGTYEGLEGGRFNSELYYELHQVNSLYDRILVGPSIVPRHFPLLGKLVSRLRRELHNLVIYYVNMLGGRQVAFNRAVVNVLNKLIEQLDEKIEVDDLRKEMEEIRRRLANLEAKMEE